MKLKSSFVSLQISKPAEVLLRGAANDNRCPETAGTLIPHVPRGLRRGPLWFNRADHAAASLDVAAGQLVGGRGGPLPALPHALFPQTAAAQEEPLLAARALEVRRHIVSASPSYYRHVF